MSKRFVISFFICVALAVTFVPCFAGVSPNAKNFGFMKDSRDGQVYKMVTVGEQIWMEKNIANTPTLNDEETKIWPDEI